MRVIALTNQKGGCGKTTTATNLAAALADSGRSVLLLDNDPQGHATLAFGLHESDFSLGTYDLYMTPDITVADVQVEVSSNLRLIPAGVELSAVEQALSREADKELRLRRALRRSRPACEYLVLDCPPSLGLLTFNALLCSGEALVPLDPSRFGVQAVHKLEETLQVLESRCGHRPAIHLLMVNVDSRTRFVRRLLQDLERSHGTVLLETMLHGSVRYREAAEAGVPLVRYAPASWAARECRLLAGELEARAGDVPAIEDAADWSDQLPGPSFTGEGVRFLASFPQAHHVRLTGSFCDWSAEGVEMARRQDGFWECSIPVPPGRHEYRYIVDGTWLADPHNAALVGNEFGETNSLIEV
jgi:chromosome partitioning protein